MTKSLKFNDIPSEIWENIFSKLPTCTQNECQQVCRQWYPPAKRAFLEHIVLASCDEVEKFVAYFMSRGTPALFSSVRTFRIGSAYTPPDRARHLLETNAIEALIAHFPNVLEFVISSNCVNLAYFQKQDIANAMVRNWPNLQVFRVDAGWLHPDERKIYLQTNYSLRKSIRQLIHYEHTYVTEDLGGLKAYLSSFPRLKQIKVVSREVCKLESALPILEYSQGLTSLDLYVTREDVGCIFDGYVNRGGDGITLKGKANLLRQLKISMATFCIYTVEFIIQHLIALRQIYMTVNQVNLKEWTDAQKRLFSDGLLDYLCLKDTFSFKTVKVNYNRENDYMNEILRKLYHQLPLQHHGRVERHVHLGLFNNSPEFSTDYNNMYGNVRNFGFEMRSSREQNDNVLVRSAHFNHFILLEGGLRNKSLKYLRHMDGILEDITSLTLNTYSMWVLINVIPNIFEDTMQQFINLRKVSVQLSMNYHGPSSFLSHDITTIHPQLTHLEISAGNALYITEDMLPIASQCFPSLKYLSLWFNCGWYCDKEFLVDMEDTNLERLHLDVTPIRVQTGKVLKNSVKLSRLFFILKLTSTDNDEERKRSLYYRVSLDYLSVTQLKDETVILQREEEQDNYLTMHLVFKSVKFVNMYLYRKFSDLFRPALSLDLKDMIQTTISIS